jgi:chemotaxis protein CheD
MLAEAAAESEILYVEPGQLTVCTEPRRLRTILGSCVSVCMYDPELRHGGMNHFMLPSAPSDGETSTRYGNRAMPSLVERLTRLGSERRRLTAAVFGGARVLFGDSEFMHLGRRNVEFAQDWLSEHGIAVVSTGVLGSAARRLEFDIGTGECSERVLGGR